MSTLLTVGLANAVCATLLALVALLVGCFCRRPAVLHCLWLLVLLKLVTPPLWPITVVHWTQEPAAVVETPPREAPAYFTYSVAPVVNVENAPVVAAQARVEGPPKLEKARTVFVPMESAKAMPLSSTFVLTTEPQPSPSAATTPEETQPRDEVSLTPLLTLFWIAGIVVWFAWAGLHVCRFQRLLRHARSAGTDVQEEAERLALRMGMRHSPEICLLPGSLPPLVWGALGRVRIFFPTKLIARLDAVERASLLAHELAHVRRRDHWVRWLELIAAALYWWFPLVWLARRRLHVHEEECCDAWVVGEIPARVYAEAIVNTLDFLAEDRVPLPLMASGLAGVELLKRRLSLIMVGGAPKRLSAFARIFLLVLGLLLLSVRPNVGQTKQEEPPSKEQSPPKEVPQKANEEPTSFNAQPKDLIGGNNDVWSAVFSPEGKYVVSGGGYWDRSGEVSVWDVATHKRLRSFPDPLGIASVAVSPDGKRLASAGWSKTGALRDLATGKELARLPLDSVARVAFSPDGKLLATASEGKTVKLWDGFTGQEVADLQGDLFRWHCVTFSRDGKMVAAGGGNWDEGGVSQVTLWDVKSHKQVGKLTGHERPVLAMSFSPDNKTIATGGVDNTVKLWDAAAFTVVASLEGHENWVECVAFSPDGKKLVSAAQDASVRIWDVEKREMSARLEGIDTRARTAAFSPDSKLLVTGGANKALQLWDAATYKEVASLQKSPGQGGMAPQILSMVCSPNGKILATALDDQTIQLRDAISGDLLRVLTGHGDAVQCLAFSPDGKVLASGSPDRSVRLWNVAEGKLLRTLTGHTNWVYAVAFAPDGKTLASAAYDQTIRLWNPSSGEEIRTLKGHKGSIRALAFRPDGKLMASAGSDQSVHLWPMKGEGEPTRMRGHEDTIRALAFSPDGKTLASGGDDQTIKLWDVDGKKERASMKGPNGEILVLAFSPRGKTLVSGAGDNSVILWDPVKGTQRSQMNGHTEPVTSILFLPDGKSLLSASLDRKIKVWSAVAPASPVAARLTLKAAGERTWAAAFSPDNRTVAAVSGADEGGALHVWQSDSGKQLVDIKAPKGLRCLAFAPDGKTLATGGFDNKVQLCEPATGKVLREFKGHKGVVNSLAFAPDGRTLLTGSLDKSAILWDVATGKVMKSFEGHDDWVLAVAFAPDGKTIATASKDRVARLWNVADGKLTFSLEGHTEGVEGLAFSPDAKTLATASWDQSVRLWDAATGKMKNRLQGQKCGFLSVAFSPDGKTLATASGHYENKVPGELRLWDVATAQPVRVLQGHTTGIWCVRYAPDGKSLVSVSDDGIVKVWAVTGPSAVSVPQSTRAIPER